jgi:hypothetical protein
MDTRQNGTSWQEKEEFEKNTCESPCGENARMYWKVQGKKGKVITVKRKVVVCALAAATPTLHDGAIQATDERILVRSRAGARCTGAILRILE